VSRQHDPSFRRDLLKFACFVLALAGVAFVFFGTPALMVPTLCSIVCAALLSPWISALERRGFSRDSAILTLLGCILAVGGCAGLLIARNWSHEWLSFQANVPDYFSDSIAKITGLQDRLKASYPFLHSVDFAASLSNWGNRTAESFADRIPSIASGFLGCLFFVPILTFCFLREGRNIRRRFAQLVPNRFFESVYIVTHGVSSALSDYLRAKMIEGFLVGAMVTVGMAMIHSPYAIVLGFWAGATNILPYIGPILGALPGIIIAMLDPQGATMLLGTVAVYGTAFVTDSMVIFPGIVAKLVKLNPLVLTASVILGQYYGGIIGMLVSIPIAAAIKVLLHEVYSLVYGYAVE